MGILAVSLAALLAYLPHLSDGAARQGSPEPVLAETLELNHVIYVHQERDPDRFEEVETLNQWIIWRTYEPLNEDDPGVHVWCWRKASPKDYAVRQHGGLWRLYVCEYGRVSRGTPVTATVFRETWTIGDPEVQDASYFPKHHRSPPISGWRR